MARGVFISSILLYSLRERQRETHLGGLKGSFKGDLKSACCFKLLRRDRFCHRVLSEIPAMLI